MWVEARLMTSSTRRAKAQQMMRWALTPRGSRNLLISKRLSDKGDDFTMTVTTNQSSNCCTNAQSNSLFLLQLKRKIKAFCLIFKNL